MPEIPLGRREDQHLEFKSREALGNPEVIAREAVAMLNAEGGEIWVGLREAEGIAAEVEPIPKPEQERSRLQDYLVDTIEPSPTGREVEVSVEGEILRVLVSEGQRKPYAFLRKGGRHFVIRVGGRVRPMSREEFVEVFRGTVPSRSSGLEEATERLLDARQRRQEMGEEILWLCLEPTRSLNIDIQDRFYEELFQNPLLSGNRQSGWTFSHHERQMVLRPGKLMTSPDDYQTIEVRREGGLEFVAPLESLYWKGDAKEIWPFILLELPVSAFRIARKIFAGKAGNQDLVIADLELIGVGGWKLRPGSPGRWFRTNQPKVFMSDSDYISEQPLAFTFEEIDREPDRCAVRLVERVYEAFGFRRDALPQEFDRNTGRLVLPE